MIPRQQVRFCTSSDGARLAYATLGKGPPLVKAPNWLSHLEYELKSPMWRHWLEFLSRRHTFVRYDARGCGLSDRSPPEFSLEASVRDLEAVVDATGLERFPLLGMSGGGSIAITYARRHPKRVSHLVLYGAFARGRLKRGRGQTAVDEAMVMKKLVELGWGKNNPAFRKVFAAQFMPNAPTETIDAFDELQRQSSSAADAVGMMNVNMTGQPPDRRAPEPVGEDRAQSCLGDPLESRRGVPRPGHRGCARGGVRRLGPRSRQSRPFRPPSRCPLGQPPMGPRASPDDDVFTAFRRTHQERSTWTPQSRKAPRRATPKPSRPPSACAGTSTRT